VTHRLGHLVRFAPKDTLDRAFEVGIVLKGLNGLLELIGGIVLLLVSPSQISGVVRVVTQHTVWEDPRDVLASQLLHSANGLTGPVMLFGAAYLLIHGIVKVVLVAALLRNKLWAYPLMIAVLLAFIGYQGYRIVLTPGIGLIALTAFDVAIVALTWREYRRQRDPDRDRARRPGHAR
jgi:uncharacterized membrane protein